MAKITISRLHIVAGPTAYWIGCLRRFPKNVRWWIRERWHKLRHGYTRTEVFGLYTAAAEYILPRLKALRSDTKGCPASLTRFGEDKCHEIWEQMLDEMIFALEHVVDNEWEYELSIEDAKPIHRRMDRGLRLMGRWFRHLWT